MVANLISFLEEKDVALKKEKKINYNETMLLIDYEKYRRTNCDRQICRAVTCINQRLSPEDFAAISLQWTYVWRQISVHYCCWPRWTDGRWLQLGKVPKTGSIISVGNTAGRSFAPPVPFVFALSIHHSFSI